MTKRFWRARLATLIIAVAAAAIVSVAGARQKSSAPIARGHFEVTEATIAEAHAAMRTGKLTSHQLVEEYLRRIRAYDQSTRLNAIVLVNPNALAEADKVDQEFKRTGKMRP